MDLATSIFGTVVGGWTVVYLVRLTDSFGAFMSDLEEGARNTVQFFIASAFIIAVTLLLIAHDPKAAEQPESKPSSQLRSEQADAGSLPRGEQPVRNKVDHLNSLQGGFE